MGSNEGKAWSDECWVEFLNMVRCHDKNPAFLARHAINRVQEPTEGDPAFLGLGLTLDEDGVNVLQHDDRPKITLKYR